MIKKTKKNVARMKWFSFAMFVFNVANMLFVAKLATDGYFENNILFGFILTIALLFVLLFWSFAFEISADIQNEMENKNGKEN